MSIDLRAAEAAVRSAISRSGGAPQWLRNDTEVILREVAPLIDAAVRAQIAAEIDQWRSDQAIDGVLVDGAWSAGVLYGVTTAAQIARGDHS